MLDRLVDTFGGHHDHAPEESFQRRFLLGCDLIGLAVAAITLVQQLLQGLPLLTWFVAGFALTVVALMALLRAGASLNALTWANFVTIALFFFLASIQTDALYPEQFGWLLLLPLYAVPATRMRSPDESKASFAFSVPIAFAFAAADAVAIVIAHERGWTFHQDGTPTPWSSLGSFLPLLFAVSAMIWLFDRLLLRAEEENRALRGLLPVCAWCHKIRDDAGAWQTVDRFMRDQGTKVTHSICPTCVDKHYPEGAK